MTTARDATTARRSVGLGLVEILSWMRHCFWASVHVACLLLANHSPVVYHNTFLRFESSFEM